MEIEFDLSVRRSRDWLQVTLFSIGDAVVTADAKGTFLNPIAETLTGW